MTNRLLTQARSLRAELKRRLRNRELLAYYQPFVAADGKSWVGAEVLVRWQHPVKGMILPHVFIPLMEQTRLIVEMTTILFERVANDLSAVVDQLPKPFYLSFNISATHIADPQFIHHCRRFLARFPSSSILLLLEITEREEIITTEENLQRLRQLREAGIRLALDDFGVGYSNLKYLMEFETDVLMIDRVFVSGVPANKSARHILDSIVYLAKRLNIDTIAEGIETQSEVNYLKAKGVSFFQGYFFAQPMRIEELLVTLADPPATGSMPRNRPSGESTQKS